jgi:hypothetical protein
MAVDVRLGDEDARWLDEYLRRQLNLGAVLRKPGEAAGPATLAANRILEAIRHALAECECGKGGQS